MAEITWGRKETIVWPPHKPIYTLGALFLGLIATGFFVYFRFLVALSPLEQFSCRPTSRPRPQRRFRSTPSTGCCS